MRAFFIQEARTWRAFLLESALDRIIVYPGAIPLDTDMLNTNRNTLVSIAKLAAGILGTATALNGLSCVPTSPTSLHVLVNPGEIYSLANIDSTSYGSLTSDTTHQILKQGISLDQVNLSTPAPGSAGQSINYLVQVQYSDTDGGSTVLPYYNSSNPALAYSGPNNSGAPQNTIRQGLCNISIKPGIAAATGTQATPAPDAGYTGIWVVTVANGQTAVTSGNITQYSGAPFISETLMQKVGLASLASTAQGDTLVTTLQGGTNAVGRTVRSKIQEIVSYNDFSGTPTQKAQRAIDYVTSSGGVVMLPFGALTLGDLSIPAGVSLRGQGPAGTIVTYSGSGTFALLGGTAGTNYYGCGISNMKIASASNTTIFVNLQGTVGALVERLIIEGPINNTRTTKGVVIDGMNASAFFNHVKDVICNHVHCSYLVQSTGSAPSTQQFFTNCTALGDVGTDTTSVGYEIGNLAGGGTIITGGNIESCFVGISIDTGAASASWVGQRFEGNTYDIYINPAPNPQNFISPINLDPSKIVDSSGTGYNRHTFFGCITGAGNLIPNRLHETVTTASTSSAVANTTQGYPSSTIDLQQYTNSAGTVLSRVRWHGIYNDLSNKASGDRGNASVTIVVGVDAGKQYFNTPLTTNRAVTISTTGAINGDEFRITRTAAATGAFTLTVNGGKALNVGEWTIYTFDGGSWNETAFGSL